MYSTYIHTRFSLMDTDGYEYFEWEERGMLIYLYSRYKIEIRIELNHESSEHTGHFQLFEFCPFYQRREK